MKGFIRGSFYFGLIAMSAQTAFGKDGGRVVYGKDDRLDLVDVLNPQQRELAHSTVALMSKSDLQQNASGVIDIASESLQSYFSVCSSEPFADQPSGAFCSGSLIGKNLILTAGHCVKSQAACNGTRFVFDYAITEKGKYPTQTKEENVYACKTLLYREEVGSGADFAIIELDREVEGRTPLKLADRSEAEAPNGTSVLIIGHPSGLPTKVDGGGKVRDNSKNGYFVATTDSYGGNSGSAVFSLESGEIEGVLVRGEADFVWQNGCRVSKVCMEDGCRGEDVTKVSSIVPHLISRR